jgi:hypothetical protein
MPGIALDEAKDKVSRIRNNLAREVDQIRASSRYSDAGRKQEIAKVVLVHRKQVEGLHNNFSADNEGTRAKLAAKLFGVPAGADPATVLVYRDAFDRASKVVSADDAVAMLKRATEMGDIVLARAVAGHAHTNKWRDVTADYAEAAGLSDCLDELNALPSGGLLRTAVTALFSVPTPPELQPGIGDISNAQLQRLADGEDLS